MFTRRKDGRHGLFIGKYSTVECDPSIGDDRGQHSAGEFSEEQTRPDPQG